jgi:PAS domain S-box-containing protein
VAMNDERLNILLVDDQPAKLLSYEVILQELGENLLKANSARGALEQLLKNDVAVVLTDVCMPELDGFQLAAMLHEHPRFKNTAVIFVSAIHLSEMDRLQGYATGAVDYLPVPVVPEILRAKVRVFVELYRKTRQLELLNNELERRVEERTAELLCSADKLGESEERLRLASEAAGFGTYDYNIATGRMHCSRNLKSLLGTDIDGELDLETFISLIHPDDRSAVRECMSSFQEKGANTHEIEFRVIRASGGVRWLLDRGRCFPSSETTKQPPRVMGTILEITERKIAEEHQQLLLAELDHRVKNILANVTAMVHLSSARADSVKAFVSTLDGRIRALSNAHGLLSRRNWVAAELLTLVTTALEPFRSGRETNLEVEGPSVQVGAKVAQCLAMILHELATNAVKYGALSVPQGTVIVSWSRLGDGRLRFAWRESGGPLVLEPEKDGFGLTVLRTVGAEIGAQLEFSFRPEGIEYVLVGPMIHHNRMRAQPKQLKVTDARKSLAVGPAPLAERGLRILIVEDEPLIALQLQYELENDGLCVIGPAYNLEQGIKLAQSEVFDAAVVDINLGSNTSADIANRLLARQIPFAFATGYSDSSILPEHLRTVPRLGKPFATEEIRRMITHLVGDARAAMASAQSLA